MKAIVDRFENGCAVLLFGDHEIKVDFPMELLPNNIREGSVLDFTISLDLVTEGERREKISNLLEKLKNKNK